MNSAVSACAGASARPVMPAPPTRARAPPWCRPPPRVRPADTRGRAIAATVAGIDLVALAVHHDALERLAAQRLEGAGPDVQRDRRALDRPAPPAYRQQRLIEMQAGSRCRHRTRHACQQALIALTIGSCVGGALDVGRQRHQPMRDSKNATASSGSSTSQNGALAGQSPHLAARVFAAPFPVAPTCCREAVPALADPTARARATVRYAHRSACAPAARRYNTRVSLNTSRSPGAISCRQICSICRSCHEPLAPSSTSRRLAERRAKASARSASPADR
jgi:hypothetical protein